MNVHFAFGKTGLELRLPDRYSYKLLEARSASALPDWREALITALDAPIAGPPLQELAAGHERTMGAVRARLLKYGRINA